MNRNDKAHGANFIYLSTLRSMWMRNRRGDRQGYLGWRAFSSGKGDPHSRDAGLDGGGGAQRLYASTVGGEGNRQNNHSPGQNNFLTVAGWLSRSCDNCMLQPCHEYPRSLHPQPSPLNPFGISA